MAEEHSPLFSFHHSLKPSHGTLSSSFLISFLPPSPPPPHHDPPPLQPPQPPPPTCFALKSVRFSWTDDACALPATDVSCYCLFALPPAEIIPERIHAQNSDSQGRSCFY